jgi:HPt (histidine-containing phosphotransfer) domain-containing protein
MSNDSPVDLEQLNSITDGNMDDLRLLIETYLTTTEDDFKKFQKALDARDTATLYRLAHGGAGASLSYGMAAIVPALKSLETDAKAGNLENAPALITEAKQQFDRIKVFLQTHFPPPSNKKAA